MSTLFFTADHHFGHRNIIKFCQRPFETAMEMDDEMVRRWNEKVGPEDEVYHLGDVGLINPDILKKILNRLNGKIYLVKGNHEHSALRCAERFEWIKDYHELWVDDPESKTGKQLVVLFHYALKVWRWSYRGTFHLYGHSHGSLPDDSKARAFDIGVDCHDFYPLSYAEVKAIMLNKEWERPF